jgi:hypothetical protein
MDGSALGEVDIVSLQDVTNGSRLRDSPEAEIAQMRLF